MAGLCEGGNEPLGSLKARPMLGGIESCGDDYFSVVLHEDRLPECEQVFLSHSDNVGSGFHSETYLVEHVLA
ncbi:hypothetical protein ANN_09791 [Periplaneta americana]|uniref:Uncharacterized protein n=1 Tax=Periplaneta americana TaxID=6978 RepID=A0ABQ8TPK1_PERAM|nr:hypothetical protein ANN_09791 [Periplaneta americana]